MSVAALLQQNPVPTEADIDQAVTNICRCGAPYTRQARPEGGGSRERYD
jgi:aerobic-type carbon monoxide dehydrogenase small subunit (CoxS/CutS family)